MRIACLTIGDLQTPSTWYRIGQYLPYFQAHGVEVDLIPKEKISFDTLGKYDLILNQKNLFPTTAWSRFIRQKRVLFDFDDALWTRPIKPYNWLTQLRINHRLKFWLKHAKMTTVANQYLSDYAGQHTEAVSVIPMSLDLDLWKMGKKERGLIGWSGAPHNFHYLEKIQSDLMKLKSDFPFISFAIYSGKKPNLKIPFEYVPFKKGEEHHFVPRLEIGLLPLDQDPYSLGKSPIKALQYMACGVPTVTNGEGATRELLRGYAEPVVSTWFDAIANLLSSPDRRAVLSVKSRQLAEENHDMKKVGKKILSLF